MSAQRGTGFQAFGEGNVRLLAVLAIAMVGFGTVVAAGIAVVRVGTVVRQPITFNHRLHIEEIGLECPDCHVQALSSVRATIPNIGICSDCHEEAVTDSPAELRLVQYIEEAEPVPWRKVYWVPDHVYFSHRRHTSIAKIECEVCHGAMREREQPVARPFQAVTMEGCIKCHDQEGAANDCVLCHV